MKQWLLKFSLTSFQRYHQFVVLSIIFISILANEVVNSLISKIKRKIRHNFATKHFIHLAVGGGKLRNLRNIGSRSSRVNINSIVFLACLPARRYAVRKNEVGPFRLVTRCIEI